MTSILDSHYVRNLNRFRRRILDRRGLRFVRRCLRSFGFLFVLPILLLLFPVVFPLIRQRTLSTDGLSYQTVCHGFTAVF